MATPARGASRGCQSAPASRRGCTSAGGATGCRRAGSGNRNFQRSSMHSRYNRLEENMLRNFEILQEHRRFTEQIRQERQEEDERRRKQMAQEAAEMRRSALHSADLAPQDSQPSKPREIGKGNMQQRCATLEEHANANEAVMGDHRTFLNEVHEIRRAQAEAAGEDYDPRGGAAPPPQARRRPGSALAQSLMNPTTKLRAHQEECRWMDSAMQGAAYTKAMAKELGPGWQNRGDPDFVPHPSGPAAAFQAFQAAPPASPGPAAPGFSPPPALSSSANLGGEAPANFNGPASSSATSALGSTNQEVKEVRQPSKTLEVPPFPAAPGARPLGADRVDAFSEWGGRFGSKNSVSTTAGGRSRPVSAVATAATHARLGGVAGSAGPRPVSASSIQARCRALTDTVKKTQKTIEVHRDHIDGIHQFRQQAADRLVQALREEFANFSITATG